MRTFSIAGSDYSHVHQLSWLYIDSASFHAAKNHTTKQIMYICQRLFLEDLF